ncbi:MAG: hypothetical protein AB8G86_17270 [Saprospiraceae bacterium]
MRQTNIGCFFINIFLLLTSSFLFAQNKTLEAYVFEDGNRGYLSDVAIQITQKSTNNFITSTATNDEGLFTVILSVGETYLIQAHKKGFLSQQINVAVKSTNQPQKVYAKIKMFRRPNHLVDKSPQLSSPEIVQAVTEYGIDTKKITASVNPDGVALANLVHQDDVYAQITNATRLADENYVDASEDESKKLYPMLTNYQPTAKVDPSIQNSGPKINEDLPNPYDQNSVDKVILSEPKFGETMVAVAQNNPRTQTIPTNYNGYKIEFFTSLSALPASHKIFSQHGNIVLERKKNGLYSYLLGSFNDKKVAETFLEESLLNRYPTATLITYENGRRQVAKKSTKVRTKPVFAPPR